MTENELKATVMIDEETGTFKRKYQFYSKDFSFHDGASGNKFRQYNNRKLETSLDEETLDRRIQFDEASRLELYIDTDGYKSEANRLEPNINIDRCEIRHLDEASRLELNVGSERHNSCSYCGVHLKNYVQERTHRNRLGHSDIHVNSDTQDRSHQESLCCSCVGLDNVTAGRRNTERSDSFNFDLDSDTVERKPLSKTASINVHNDTEFNNSAYCIEHDSETAERRPSDSCSHYDVDQKNVTAARRHVDGASPYDFNHDNDALGGRPLRKSTYNTEPEINTLQTKMSDNRIYFELDLDADAMFEWKDSDRSGHSAADRQKFRGMSSKLKNTETGLECLICYERKATVSRRKCCKFPVCRTCLETYYLTKVSMTVVRVQCIGDGCNNYVSEAEIMSYLTADLQDRFLQLLVDASCDQHRKTCPRCSHITEVDEKTRRERGKQKYGLRCLCPKCNLIWCFKCQAPWHEPLSCQEFQRGDRQFKSWMKQQWKGQANAQRCPKCRISIQRNGGCDHMTCSRCSTDFCYQCGEKYQKIKFIGDHRSRYSILGCKYRFKPNSPVTRRLVRGSIFGGKLLAAPVIGGLALGAGAVVMGLGLVALPFYGGYRLHKLVKQKRKEREEKATERSWREFLDAVAEEDPEIGALSRYRQYRARSTIFSTDSDYLEVDFDDFYQSPMDYYGDDSDEDSNGIYSYTSVDEEREHSVEGLNSPSPLPQSSYEAYGEASHINMEAADLRTDTGALNSGYVELPADSKALNGSRDGARVYPADSVRTGARIPGRCSRTHFTELTRLAMNKTTGLSQSGKQNPTSSADMAEGRGCDKAEETCDEVTHL